MARIQIPVLIMHGNVPIQLPKQMYIIALTVDHWAKNAAARHVVVLLP